MFNPALRSLRGGYIFFLVCLIVPQSFTALRFLKYFRVQKAQGLLWDPLSTACGEVWIRENDPFTDPTQRPLALKRKWVYCGLFLVLWHYQISSFSSSDACHGSSGERTNVAPVPTAGSSLLKGLYLQHFSPEL